MVDQEVFDYAEEGRKLLARVNMVDANGNVLVGPPNENSGVRRYAPYNIIYKHPSTEGAIYVGNYMAAESMDHLNSIQTCRRIVFCQNNDGKKHFEDDPNFVYFDFPIGRWRSLLSDRKPETVYAFFAPFFQFLDDQLLDGKSILIHCLAGAHRAGTAGIASLMHLTGMTASEAIKTAQTLRPAINPIGDFPKLLALLEEGMKRQGK